MPRDITLILPPQRTIGAIYISDLKTAQSSATLRDNRIGAILTVSRRGKLNYEAKEVPRYLYLPADDRPDFDISQYFPLSINFIEESRKHTNILVHCIAGVSRSATIIAAYLIYKFGYSADQAIAFMQERRGKVSPNKGFRKQLQLLGRQKAKKVKEDDEETLSSPIITASQATCSFARQKVLEVTNASNTGERQNDRLNTMHSSRTHNTRSSSDQLSKRERTAEKIEKMKVSLVHKFNHSTYISNKPAKNPETNFASLLQSNIYQNKLKVKK